MRIGDFEVGSTPYIIAEAGLNHNGILGDAAEMVVAAKEAGCNAVKFQTFKADEFCRKDDPLYPIFKQCELPDYAWRYLKFWCDDIGIDFLSTPQNRSDLDLLLPLGINAIKVGSDDFCNLPLLSDYASEELPMILSTGMANWIDVDCALTMTRWVYTIVMVCTSQYPCPASEVNIERVRTLKERGVVSGFSDHTVGNTAAIMAVALGASVFEKHFTLDKTLPGPDHEWACDPAELKSWVDAIHEAWAMRGTGSFELSENEKDQKRKYQRKPGEQLRGE